MLRMLTQARNVIKEEVESSKLIREPNPQTIGLIEKRVVKLLKGEMLIKGDVTILSIDFNVISILLRKS